MTSAMSKAGRQMHGHQKTSGLLSAVKAQEVRPPIMAEARA